MSIIIKSEDNNICVPIISKNSYKFTKIEEEIYEPVKSEYISKRYIDFNEFNEILEDVSKICEKELKLDENNRIKYGGEFIIVKTKDLNKILVNSFWKLYMEEIWKKYL